MEESIHWNYTTALNIIFLLLAAVSVIRFLRTGGPEMLRMIGGFGIMNTTVRSMLTPIIMPKTDYWLLRFRRHFVLAAVAVTISFLAYAATLNSRPKNRRILGWSPKRHSTFHAASFSLPEV
jgi:hypothetical protein